MNDTRTSKSHLLRNIFVSIIAAIAIATLIVLMVTACSSSNSKDQTQAEWNARMEAIEADRPHVTYYVNEATGHITKYVNSGSTETFEDGYTASDTEVENPYGWAYSDIPTSITTDDSVNVDGKPYPISSKLSWTIDTSKAPSIEALLVTFFNQNIATPTYGTAAMVSHYSVEDLVEMYINDKVTQATSDGTLPKAQYELTGKSLVAANSAVTDDWANGLPAATAYQQINKGNGTGEYYYSFNCATYDVTPVDSGLTEAANALFADAGVRFTLATNTIQLTTETAEPCEVLPANSDAKDWRQDVPLPATGTRPDGTPGSVNPYYPPYTN